MWQRYTHSYFLLCTYQLENNASANRSCLVWSFSRVKKKHVSNCVCFSVMCRKDREGSTCTACLALALRRSPVWRRQRGLRRNQTQKLHADAYGRLWNTQGEEEGEDGGQQCKYLNLVTTLAEGKKTCFPCMNSTYLYKKKRNSVKTTAKNKIQQMHFCEFSQIFLLLTSSYYSPLVCWLELKMKKKQTTLNR